MRTRLHLWMPALFFCLAARAQDTAPTAHAPDGVTFERILSILIPTTPNAPFTGKVTLEWERFAAEGSRLHTGNQRAVARDSQGRVFQERRFIVSYADASHSAVSQIEFEDPLRKTEYICRPQFKVCELQQLRSIPAVVMPPAAPHNGQQQDPSRNVQWEELGSQAIEGFEVHGTRETLTFAPGTIGNDQPVTSTREFWYSPKLGINLLTIRKDPTSGTQTFRLTEISEREPDPGIFAPPSDYKIIDTRKDTIIDTHQGAPLTQQPTQ